MQKNIKAELAMELNKLNEELEEKTKEFRRHETWLNNRISRTELKSKRKFQKLFEKLAADV